MTFRSECLDPWNPNELLVCPYDATHRIAAKRYQFHIVKCRKNHPDKDFVPCPFNARHIFLRSYLRGHLGSCPDKKCIDADIHHQAVCNETGELEDVIPVQQVEIHSANSTESWFEDTEDWDAEAELYAAEKEKKRQEEIQNSESFRRTVCHDLFSDSSSDHDSMSPSLTGTMRSPGCRWWDISPNSKPSKGLKTSCKDFSDTQTDNDVIVVSKEVAPNDSFQSNNILGKIQSANYVPLEMNCRSRAKDGAF